MDRGDGSELCDKLWFAIKSRDAESSRSGRGSEGKGQSKGKSKSYAGTSLAAISETCRQSQQSFDFRKHFPACLRALYWDNKRTNFKADFVTETAGVLNGIVVQSEEVCHDDVGSVFMISLKLERAPAIIDKDQKSKDLVLANAQPSAAAVPFLESCRLVFLRETTGEVLLLRSRLSPAGQNAQFLMKQVLPEISGNIPAEMKAQVSQLVSQLSDLELRAIVESSDADTFKEPFGSETSKFVDATSAAWHCSLMASQAWGDFARAASAEESRREGAHAVSHTCYRMLTFRPACQLKSGAVLTNQMTYDDPLSSFLEQLHRTTLRASVRITSNPNEASPSIDVCDQTGRVAQRLFPCVIPEELIDAGSPDAPLPWLIPTAQSHPKWVSTADPDHIAALLRDDASEGFAELPAAICTLARRQHVTLRCTRA